MLVKTFGIAVYGVEAISITIEAKLTVNLAPADIRKSGSAFYLPIAIGVLGAKDQIENVDVLKDYVIIDELSLDGSIQSIKDALSIAIRARKEYYIGLIVPKQNAPEAAMVNNLKVYVVTHINEVVNFLKMKTHCHA